jgi:DNA-binding protein H-NS
MGECVAMPKVSLKTIQRQIAFLQLKAEKAKQNNKISVIRRIQQLMDAHSISIYEVRTASKGKRGRPPGARKGKKAAIMYRNKKTGETWSGRGRTVRWLAQAEKAGHKREEFLAKKR